MKLISILTIFVFLFSGCYGQYKFVPKYKVIAPESKINLNANEVIINYTGDFKGKLGEFDKNNSTPQLKDDIISVFDNSSDKNINIEMNFDFIYFKSESKMNNLGGAGILMNVIGGLLCIMLIATADSGSSHSEDSSDRDAYSGLDALPQIFAGFVSGGIAVIGLFFIPFNSDNILNVSGNITTKIYDSKTKTELYLNKTEINFNNTEFADGNNSVDSRKLLNKEIQKIMAKIKEEILSNKEEILKKYDELNK